MRAERIAERNFMEGEGECGQGWGGRQHGNAGGVSVADGEGERAGGELVDGDGLAEVVDAVAGEEAEVGDLGAVDARGDWVVGGEVADGVVAGWGHRVGGWHGRRVEAMAKRGEEIFDEAMNRGRRRCVREGGTHGQET